MHTTPDVAFFKGNRERLQSLFTGTAPIVLTANGLLQRNSDSNFPFRQDSSFWYLTGIEDPDIILVIDKNKEYLIVPERDHSREAFDGSISSEQLESVSGIETVYGSIEGWKLLSTRLKKVKHVATIAAAPGYIEQHGLYTNPSRARLIEQVTTCNNEIELLDLRSHITRMRAIKQPIELEIITSAIDLTAKVLTKLKKKGWEKFSYEYELEAAITAGFREHGASHAYQPIVAGGKNACTLHYVQNNAAIEQGSLLLLDVGAEISNYAADITRTYIVGEASKRQSQVHAAVLSVQEYALSLVRPGTIMKEYEEAVCLFMGEKLRELGLIKTTDSEHVREYYPHATSHFLGLDVHDVGEYDRPLEPGMVLTIEPGIYIPDEGIGIRIEDNIVITETGYDLLSAKLPRMLE